MQIRLLLLTLAGKIISIQNDLVMFCLKRQHFPGVSKSEFIVLVSCIIKISYCCKNDIHKHAI